MSLDLADFRRAEAALLAAEPVPAQKFRNYAFTTRDKISNLFGGDHRDGETNIQDISYWQAPEKIDYDAFAEKSDGVILRAAYGKWADTRFETHYTMLSDRGVKLGCYHYLVGNLSVADQIAGLKSAMSGYDLPLGMWADVEDTRSETGLNRSLVQRYLAEADATFNLRQDIYTSMYRWRQIMLDSVVEANEGRRAWVAHYSLYADKPYMPAGWSQYWLWQYTSSYHIPAAYYSGIDNSRFYQDEDAWYRLFGIEPPTTDPNNTQLKLALQNALDMIEARANQDQIWATNALEFVNSQRSLLN
jgi:hypothetical protein